MEKKKILVTGGAGFVGSHLIERLIKDGNEVVSLDNYFTGKAENHIKGASYVRGDTKDISALIDFSPATIFHLGEYSRVERSFKDMRTVWEYNMLGTFEVLEFCRSRGAKLIYAGSSTKFGDDGLGRDQSPYAWSKASNTDLVNNYGEWFNLLYAITYFYNVYGEREIANGPYATVIGIFKEQYRARKPLTVVSPGTQRRNFTHVDDIVNGLVAVGERGKGDGYGLGSKESHSICELAEMFGGEVEMLPGRMGNRMTSGLNTERSERELGWKAEKQIEQYIEDVKKDSEHPFHA
jgi:UDP-glucose 4-epimerase